MLIFFRADSVFWNPVQFFRGESHNLWQVQSLWVLNISTGGTWSLEFVHSFGCLFAVLRITVIALEICP